MNEALTNEVLEAMAGCVGGCPMCEAREVCKRNQLNQMNILATALLEERAKPKVWDGAPDNAFRSIVNWYDESRGFIKSKVLTRELPKTRARQIAEEVTAIVNKAIEGISVNEIEAVLNKYAEELTNTKETQ